MCANILSILSLFRLPDILFLAVFSYVSSSIPLNFTNRQTNRQTHGFVQNTTDFDRSQQVMASQERSSKVMIGQNRSGQVKTRQGWTGQDKTTLDRSGQDRCGKVRTDHSQPQ